MVIGIPQSLYYYYYYPFWTTLFQTLGFDVVLSPSTNSAIMAKGLSITPDEYCLPVKIHRGHVAYLEEHCDVIFSAGYGRHGKRGHFCPKLTGLPDVVRVKHGKAVTFWHDLDENDRMAATSWLQALAKLKPGLAEMELSPAWEAAWKAQEDFADSWVDSGSPMNSLSTWSYRPNFTSNSAIPQFRLAVIGHPYLVYDPWITRRLFETLRKYRTEIVFQEPLSREALTKRWAHQNKKVYWPVGQDILSAALHYSEQNSVDGIIQISSCLCGPDAIIGDLLAKYLRRNDDKHFPLLQLTLDEHSGWAGLQTRVEAFMDLLDWRNSRAQI